MGLLKFLKGRAARKEREEERDADAVAQELWQADFSRPEECRFRSEETCDFAASFCGDGLLLRAKRKGALVWALNPLYRYADCVIEAEISFPLKASVNPPSPAQDDPSSAGASCAGILFRYINDTTFYEALVSDKGLVRLDAVVNGTPVSVLGWTGITRDARLDALFAEEASAPDGSPAFSLRVIAERTSITLVLNNRWIAECEDDTIQAAGKIAFAAQNWRKQGASAALLRALSIESRPIEVEALYTRWNQFIKIPAAARRTLAETKFAMGQYTAALIELKKAWRAKPPDAADLLFAARICLAQRLYPEAKDYARKALEEATRAADAEAQVKATEELGAALYAAGDLASLDSLLEETAEDELSSSAFLLNLVGHAAFYRRNFEEAAERYSAAARMEPDEPLFSLYAGSSLFECGKANEAVESWLLAGAAFLQKGALDDIAALLPKLEGAAANDERVAALGLKYCYAAGDAAKLDEYAAKVEKAGSGDAGAWHILGLLCAGKGQEEEARSRYRRAIALDGSFLPARLRLAESLFNANLEYKEELDAALAIGQEDGWTRNLAAMAALREGDLERASAEIAAARMLLPDESAILINYAEIERQRGRLDEALKAFDSSSGELLRAGAALLARDGRLEEAEDWYKKACKRCPNDAELLADRAENCMALGLLSEADDLLRRALDLQKSPRALRLIALLAERKGEFPRAEIALLSAIEEFPDEDELLCDLAAVCLMEGKASKAAEAARSLRKRGRADLAEGVERDIAKRGSRAITCARCGREWLVPKDLPPQGRLSLTAQPPDDLPAGKCEACGRVYCIACAKPYLDKDSRFHCEACGGRLKLADSGIVFLLSKWKNEG